MAAYIAIYRDNMLGVREAEALEISAEMWEPALSKAQRYLLELNDEIEHRFELQRIELVAQ